MSETVTLQDKQPLLSPEEIEALVENGPMTPLMADEYEHPVVFRYERSADREFERELERLVDEGFSEETAARMLGAKPDDEKQPAPHNRGPGYTKDGRRRKIRTSADARAADRLPDDQWMLR